MAKWFVAAKKADFEAIGKKYGVSPVIARIVRNRGLIEEAEIHKYFCGRYADMHNPWMLKGMEATVTIIQGKIRADRQIRIIGDYDIDGVCAAYILYRGLSHWGAKVDIVIPHRQKDGYGLNVALVQGAYEAGVDTIVTCDNGIAAKEEIALAKQLGMTVIITDHHEVPYQEIDGERQYSLPDADVVVNPKQMDDIYPWKEICGAFIAFKVMQALAEREEKSADELLEELIEFAAFATIGDVMPLQDENRILVKEGLKRMQQTRNIGLEALIQVSDLVGKELSPYHIGFVLGPCLNASGRLDSAEKAVDLFRASTKEAAVNLAADLKAYNDSRKKLTQEGLEDAIDQIEKSTYKQDKILVVFLPECHESLAGIIAGRLRERYERPALVITRAEIEVKGSARSVEAYHMYEELCKCKEYFIKFGGHKMAAGFSLKESDIVGLRQDLNDNCVLSLEELEDKIVIDVPMPMKYIEEELINQLSVLEPFGVGNAKPVFAQQDLYFLEGRILGQNKNVGKFRVIDQEKNTFEVIYFGDLEKFHTYIAERFGEEESSNLYQGKSKKILLSVIYYPTFNEFRGQRSIQIVMNDYQ